MGKNSPNEFYNYATFIDILLSGCHYIILQVLVWNITMSYHAKISGYTPKAVAKILKALDSPPVKGSWRIYRKKWGNRVLPLRDNLAIKESSSRPCWGCDIISNTSICCTKWHARTLQKVTIIQWEKHPVSTTFCERALSCGKH